VQYNIARDRLLTGGYGASRPVETNDTLEGRAQSTRGTNARIDPFERIPLGDHRYEAYLNL
jgi:flagellar motor protein MotB